MPRRRPRKTARNPPQQSRSRATVSVILDAAIRVLEQEGPEAATTSRIAEVAGVSVGTLYQYFANRDSILNALQDREFERATTMMRRVLSGPALGSEREIARQVIVELLKMYRAAPALHRVLAVEGLRVMHHEQVQAFDLRMVSAIRSFLALAAPSVRRQNMDAAAFVVYQSVRAVMLAYLLECPPGLDDSALTEELTDLIMRYLVDLDGSQRASAERSALSISSD